MKQQLQSHPSIAIKQNIFMSSLDYVIYFYLDVSR